jgi:hypothetical protein
VANETFKFWTTEILLEKMEEDHLIHTAIKIERDGFPAKMGQNIETKNLFAHMLRVIDKRDLMKKFLRLRIKDAKECGDTRRLIIAVAEKEKMKCL